MKKHYVKLIEPWDRVPLLTQESIDRYFEHNVKPHIGTSYGEVEKQHWQGLKLAYRHQCELISLPAVALVE